MAVVVVVGMGPVVVTVVTAVPQGAVVGRQVRVIPARPINSKPLVLVWGRAVPVWELVKMVHEALMVVRQLSLLMARL